MICLGSHSMFLILMTSIKKKRILQNCSDYSVQIFGRSNPTKEVTVVQAQLVYSIKMERRVNRKETTSPRWWGLETSFQERRLFANSNFSLREHSFLNVVSPRVNENIQYIFLNIPWGKMTMPSKPLEDVASKKMACFLPRIKLSKLETLGLLIKPSVVCFS